MPKAKKRAPGEFAPTQFATCIENGLNIHAQAKPTASKKKEASKSTGKKHNIVVTPAAKEAKRKLNQKYPRIECTNGAMEALQLCHSEFIKATSTALVALVSSKPDAAAASSKKKVSFSATTKTVTYNEDHVVQCMKQMGFSNLVERAMKSLNTGSSKLPHTNNNKVKQSKQQQLKQPSKPPPSAQNKKRKRKSNPLDDAAMLAEQERLLSESARRVYQNHNQQQQQDLQTQQEQSQAAVAATSTDLGKSGDAGGALV